MITASPTPDVIVLENGSTNGHGPATVDRPTQPEPETLKTLRQLAGQLDLIQGDLEWLTIHALDLAEDAERLAGLTREAAEFTLRRLETDRARHRRHNHRRRNP